jgi:hypothetical protein
MLNYASTLFKAKCSADDAMHMAALTMRIAMDAAKASDKMTDIGVNVDDLVKTKEYATKSMVTALQNADASKIAELAVKHVRESHVFTCECGENHKMTTVIVPTDDGHETYRDKDICKSHCVHGLNKTTHCDLCDMDNEYMNDFVCGCHKCVEKSLYPWHISFKSK